MKGRTLAALTAALFMVAMVGQAFAIVPATNPVKHCGMKMSHDMHGQAGHNCKHEMPQHEMPKMPCCPMPVSQNTMPSECMSRGECCEISEDRTRSSRRDALASRSGQADEAPLSVTATAERSTPHARTPIWVEVPLRHTHPVFDLKTDSRT